MGEDDRGLPHLDARGAAHMVDVADKQETRRVAIAEAFVSLSDATVELVTQAALKKGDAIAVARIAGISAAKKTADLIPLAHPLALTHVSVDVDVSRAQGGARIEARVETVGKTGVEMEALTAASVAALTLYDMVKKRERSATISNVRLLEKSGGVSGDFRRKA